MRKINQQNIRKISKVASGRVFVVTIPVGYIRKLKWKVYPVPEERLVLGKSKRWS
jgi:hypothetical protein